MIELGRSAIELMASWKVPGYGRVAPRGNTRNTLAVRQVINGLRPGITHHDGKPLRVAFLCAELQRVEPGVDILRRLRDGPEGLESAARVRGQCAAWLVNCRI